MFNFKYFLFNIKIIYLFYKLFISMEALILIHREIKVGTFGEARVITHVFAAALESCAPFFSQ